MTSLFKDTFTVSLLKWFHLNMYCIKGLPQYALIYVYRLSIYILKPREASLNYSNVKLNLDTLNWKSGTICTFFFGKPQLTYM